MLDISVPLLVGGCFIAFLLLAGIYFAVSGKFFTDSAENVFRQSVYVPPSYTYIERKGGERFKIENLDEETICFLLMVSSTLPIAFNANLISNGKNISKLYLEVDEHTKRDGFIFIRLKIIKKSIEYDLFIHSLQEALEKEESDRKGLLENFREEVIMRSKPLQSSHPFEERGEK